MNSNKEIVLKLSVEETNLILAGLGNLPYIRVFELIHMIQDKSRKQLNKKSNDNSDAIEIDKMLSGSLIK